MSKAPRRISVVRIPRQVLNQTDFNDAHNDRQKNNEVLSARPSGQQRTSGILSEEKEQIVSLSTFNLFCLIEKLMLGSSKNNTIVKKKSPINRCSTRIGRAPLPMMDSSICQFRDFKAWEAAIWIGQNLQLQFEVSQRG